MDLVLAPMFGDDRQPISVSICLRHVLVLENEQNVSMHRSIALALHGHSVGMVLTNESTLAAVQSSSAAGSVPVLEVPDELLDGLLLEDEATTEVGEERSPLVLTIEDTTKVDG